MNTPDSFWRSLFHRHRRIVVVRPDLLTPAQLDEAIGGVAETHPVYRAFMQLIDQLEAEAHEHADEDVHIRGAMEAHIGGAKYLRTLRQSVLQRRERFAKRRSASREGLKALI